MLRRHFLRLLSLFPFLGKTIHTSQKDTLESLCAEFNWHLDAIQDVTGNASVMSEVAYLSDPENDFRYGYVWIVFEGRKIPLREQFIVETAKNPQTEKGAPWRFCINKQKAKVNDPNIP